jgi:hypothetical protein
MEHLEDGWCSKHLATTEHFKHQAHLRLVSECPIWVCLSAQSILGDTSVPTFPNIDEKLQFYYHMWVETIRDYHG